MKYPRKVIFTGETDPSHEPQALNTKVSLLNLLRISEKLEIAKQQGSELRNISDVVNVALNQYFENLPVKEADVIETTAALGVEFLVAQETRRASYSTESQAGPVS